MSLQALCGVSQLSQKQMMQSPSSTPVYGAFDSSASDAKRPIIAVPMNRNEDNRYSVDYSTFEGGYR